MTQHKAMQYLFWRIRYTLLLRKYYGVRTAWYSSGCYGEKDGVISWQELSPEEAVSEELSAAASMV